MASIWDFLGAGLNLAGGVAGYAASKQAGRTQADAANAAAANFRPYAELGDQAAGQLQAGLNKNALLKDFGREDFRTDPGYKFRLSQGNQAIDRAAGARGSRYSGATLKALQRYAQDYASGEYQNAYDRYNTNRTMNYNFLAGPAQIGAGAQGQVGNYMSAAGDARAAGQIGAASNLWGGINDAYNVLTPRKNNNPYIYMMPQP